MRKRKPIKPAISSGLPLEQLETILNSYRGLSEHPTIYLDNRFMRHIKRMYTPLEITFVNSQIDKSISEEKLK